MILWKASWDCKISWIWFDRCKTSVVPRDLWVRNIRFSLLKWAFRFARVFSAAGSLFYSLHPNG